uniref:Uncharacterized protein n=1 Tax=Zonotrichia albicollis TaxID=44394 RepID=A0A8D2MW42_ZONAL
VKNAGINTVNRSTSTRGKKDNSVHPEQEELDSVISEVFSNLSDSVEAPQVRELARIPPFFHSGNVSPSPASEASLGSPHPLRQHHPPLQLPWTRIPPINAGRGGQEL